MQSRLEIATHHIDGSSTLSEPIELSEGIPFYISRHDEMGNVEKSRLVTLKEDGLHVETFDGVSIDAEPLSSDILREGWIAFNGGEKGLVYKFTAKADQLSKPNGD